MWKTEWKYLDGDVSVTVRAQDQKTGKLVRFLFECYVSEELDGYDRCELLEEVAHKMAALRNCYRSELINVRKVEK